MNMSRENRIKNILTSQFEFENLDVINESSQHSVPVDAETHFKIIAISSHFDSLSKIERHRLINNLLHKELQSGLHALTMHLFTPSEWEKQKEKIPLSPLCQRKRK